MSDKLQALETRIARLEAFITKGQGGWSDTDTRTGADVMLDEDSLISYVLGELEQRLFINMPNATIEGFDRE